MFTPALYARRINRCPRALICAKTLSAALPRATCQNVGVCGARMSSYFQTTMGWLRAPALVSSSIAVLASSLLYFKQNEIIYPRNIPPSSRTAVPKPTEFGIQAFEEVSLRTPDEESLHAYIIHPSNSQFARGITMLMFHGNAGNIGHRLPIARVLAEDLGCTVFMLEYRGYGQSTGDPNEKGLVIDAQTALDYIRNRNDLKAAKIVVYGQSLGGAVGINLVEKNQEPGDVVGLILENTFLSIRKLIPSVLPPAKYIAMLCHQLWPSDETLPRITNIPILFLSGLEDEIVPASQMSALYSLCQSSTKIWKEFPRGSHNDTVAEPNYFNHINHFLEAHVLGGSKRKESQKI